MKITAIKQFMVERFLLVRVYTDEGIVGNGEAGLWAHHPMVHAAIEELSDYYIGKDPLRMEHHYQVVARDTHFMGAVISAAQSALDVAMWDILGKAVGKPVHQLLGGKVRDKVKVFANVVGDSLDARARSAQENVADGFLSLRTQPFFAGWEQDTPSKVIKDAIAIVRTIREAVGDEIDLGVEIHRNLRLEEAIVLARGLEPYGLLYYEDPLAPESVEAIDYIAQHINIPIATGERFYNIYQFKDLIDRKTVSLIRADVSLAGGYTQMKKIAAIAEAAFIGVFPHLMGSPFNIAAFVQFDAAIPNFVLHESHKEVDRFNDLVDQPIVRENGYLIVPDRPGIGVEFDEDALARHAYGPKRIFGSFAADGAVAH